MILYTGGRVVVGQADNIPIITNTLSCCHGYRHIDGSFARVMTLYQISGSGDLDYLATWSRVCAVTVVLAEAGLAIKGLISISEGVVLNNIKGMLD